MSYRQNITPLPQYSKDQWLPTVFLAENPEAFGFVSEALPVATKTLIVSADGKPAGKGMIPPTFIYPYNDCDQLFDSLFGGILDGSDENSDIVNRSLTSTENGYEHLVSRYSAVLAQALAVQTMRALPSEYEGDAVTYYAEQLGLNISHGLYALRNKMSEFGGLAPTAQSDFSVSLAVCKIDNLQGDEFAINMFGSGNFRFFLLDYEGMKVLWDENLPRTEAHSPTEQAAAIASKTVVVQKTMPFAIIVLSDGAADRSGDSNSVVALADKNHRAHVWRDRMKVEEVMLRMIVGSQNENTFATRAEQYFSGHIVSDDSASGAFTLIGTSYDIFCAECRKRLEVLENTMTLLPDGYDEEAPPSIRSFEEAESAFIDELFIRYPSLRNTTSVILSRYIKIAVMGIINNGYTDSEDDAVISNKYIYDVYRSFDSENDEDRRQLAVNQKLLDQLMTDNWITLRPLLCYAMEDDGDNDVIRAENDAVYAQCIDMNAQLTSLASSRTEIIESLYSRVKECVEIMIAQKDNLIHNRIPADLFSSVIGMLTEDIPADAARLDAEWREKSDIAAELLQRYTAVRAELFRSDVDNMLVDCYDSVLDGSVSDGFWMQVRENISLVASEDDVDEVDKLVNMMKIISDSCGEIDDRISARAAEKRTVQHISGDVFWNKTCLAAMLRELPGWEDSEAARIDDVVHTEYRAMVARWREALALVNKQKEAFEAYRKVYNSFK